MIYPLPVEDLLHVRPATRKKLQGSEIGTIGRLAQAPLDTLIRRLSKMGAVLQTFALGLDPAPFQKSGRIPAIKSMGNSTTPPGHDL